MANGSTWFQACLTVSVLTLLHTSNVTVFHSTFYITFLFYSWCVVALLCLCLCFPPTWPLGTGIVPYLPHVSCWIGTDWTFDYLLSNYSSFCLLGTKGLKVLKVLVTQLCPTLLWPHGLQPAKAHLCIEFTRQEYWSGLPFPSAGNLPDPGIEPESPALQADSSLSEPPGKPKGLQEYQLLDM